LREKEGPETMERGEISIVAVQFVALVAVVLILSSYTPGQSAQSNPVISSVFWGPSNMSIGLHNGQRAVVNQNESVIIAYFTVAFSTQPSAVSGSRLCFAPNSTAGESTTYTFIAFNYDSSKNAYSMTLSPTAQKLGWVCTYTIKVTDALSQTTTWLGSVEFNK
jgi:hypothetical protein